MTKTNIFYDGKVHVQKSMCSTCIFRPPEKPKTPCVEWTGATSGGYGVRRIKGKLVRVHRLTWEEANGPIPEGVIILHRCDNPPCYRLDHLMTGTHKTNSDDKFLKGRANILSGEAAGRAILTEAQVWEILERRDKGESYGSIAKVYGVSRSCIQHVAEGRNWKHLLRPLGTLMDLEDGRVEGMVEDATKAGGTIPCHQTLEHRKGAVCNGFFTRHKTAELQIAERLGFVEFVQIEEDK